jgi:hypothetical protein
MIKLLDLLEKLDLPKNKWVNLSNEEKKEAKEILFKLIDNAYASIGGHPNYKSPNDVIDGEGDANYVVIDLDDDPEIDAVVTFKDTPAGKKYASIGHDGSKSAKSQSINKVANDLKSQGFFVEVSGTIKDIMKAKGVPQVTDPEVIKKVLKGKDIEMNDDGSYTRKIGGKLFTKSLFGNPFV